MDVWPDLTRRLDGSVVALEPLESRHEDRLWEAARHIEIWDWLPHIGASRDYFHGWFEASLAEAAAGREGVFATVERAGGKPVGSTRYLNIRRGDGVVEIGWTWLTPAAWRTGANIEAKLLMLTHAFDGLGCVRVEFKTDARNERSRAALAALPAKFEGVLRKHMTVPDVGVRDSAYYSIVDDEWPAVRGNLERRLAAKRRRRH